eukprot:56980-Rhodomonas_salina.4
MQHKVFLLLIYVLVLLVRVLVTEGHATFVQLHGSAFLGKITEGPIHALQSPPLLICCWGVLVLATSQSVNPDFAWYMDFPVHASARLQIGHPGSNIRCSLLAAVHAAGSPADTQRSGAAEERGGEQQSQPHLHLADEIRGPGCPAPSLPRHSHSVSSRHQNRLRV